jgi:hypothetical protein
MSEQTPDQKRFLSYVKKEENGCWRWTGSRAITGYCNFFYNTKTMLAHRASLLIFGKVKQLTPGLHVTHSCSNRDCVAPDHLTEKTQSENNGADKKRDGKDNSGERCHFSKLDWTKVCSIRNSTQKVKELAEKYGVSCSCISSIRKNKTWVKTE